MSDRRVVQPNDETSLVDDNAEQSQYEKPVHVSQNPGGCWAWPATIEEDK